MSTPVTPSGIVAISQFDQQDNHSEQLRTGRPSCEGWGTSSVSTSASWRRACPTRTVLPSFGLRSLSQQDAEQSDQTLSPGSAATSCLQLRSQPHFTHNSTTTQSHLVVKPKFTRLDTTFILALRKIGCAGQIQQLPSCRSLSSSNSLIPTLCVFAILDSRCLRPQLKILQFVYQAWNKQDTLRLASLWRNTTWHDKSCHVKPSGPTSIIGLLSLLAVRGGGEVPNFLTTRDEAISTVVDSTHTSETSIGG